jgi:hypothetical protein
MSLIARLAPKVTTFAKMLCVKVCPRCWFSGFYCFLPPLFDAHSHEWSIERGVSPAVVWRGIFCECTASVARWEIMGPCVDASKAALFSISQGMRARAVSLLLCQQAPLQGEREGFAPRLQSPERPGLHTRTLAAGHPSQTLHARLVRHVRP